MDSKGLLIFWLEHSASHAEKSKILMAILLKDLEKVIVYLYCFTFRVWRCSCLAFKHPNELPELGEINRFVQL